jgi:FkbM family methyltransferase
MSIRTKGLDIFKNRYAGKLKRQKLFNSLKFIILRGLNYGDGGSIELSGEIELIKSLSSRDNNDNKFVIFDVGANHGDYCNALLKNLAVKNPEIWCFEPSPVAYGQLEKACGTNPAVHLVQIGFSNVAGTFPLYTSEPGTTTASLFPLERAFNVPEKLHEFEMITVGTIDEFAEQNNITYIDFLKLDIEGNELNALIGAKNMLKSKSIRSIQFEFGTCNIDSRTYFRDFWFLLNEDYNIFRVVKDGVCPITYYTEYDEIFATINYYAELK